METFPPAIKKMGGGFSTRDYVSIPAIYFAHRREANFINAPPKT